MAINKSHSDIIWQKSRYDQIFMNVSCESVVWIDSSNSVMQTFHHYNWRTVPFVNSSSKIWIVPGMPNRQYLDYLQDLYGCSIENEQFIVDESELYLEERAIRIAEKVRILTWKKESNILHFITSPLIEQISTHTESKIDTWWVGAIEQANNKLNLLKHLNEYIYDWENIDLRELSYEDFEKLFEKYGSYVFLKLPRSASWAWVIEIKNKKSLYETYIALREKWFFEIFFQKAIPNLNAFYNVMWFIKDWEVNILWSTQQIIDNNCHIWNKFFWIDDNIKDRMETMTKDIVKRYNKEFESSWFFWVDFVKSWTDDIYLMEINWRVNWVYPSHYLLDFFDLRSKKVGTQIVAIKTWMSVDKIMTELRKERLLFSPDCDWIFPVMFIKWQKMQCVITWDSEAESENIHKKAKEILYDR